MKISIKNVIHKIFTVENIKTYIIVALCISLFAVVFIYKKFLNNDLNMQIEALTQQKDSLNLQLSESQQQIEEIQSQVNILQDEKSALESEKTSLENEKSELNSKIQQLEKKSSSSKTNVSSTSNSNNEINSVIGSWKTTVPESGETYTTIYEFKSNGDFYINSTKVGTYKDGSILFKDSNDPNFRDATYKFSNGTLYLNLYQHEVDIWVSSNYYECTKN